MGKAMVIGHRGASGYAPENTIAAFERANAMGADGIELDVHLSSDDKLVIIHDETIDRTSDGEGRVCEMTLQRLHEFSFHNNMDEFVGEKIPTLDEVLDLVKPTNMVINIELKNGVVFYPYEEMIINTVENHGMGDRVFYSSFNHLSAKKILSIRPNARVGFLYEDGMIDPVSYAIKHGVSALHPAKYNLEYPGFIDECKKNNMDLHVFTVNTREDMYRCLNHGVTSIITNYPDIARAVVDDFK